MCLRSWKSSKPKDTRSERKLDVAYRLMYISPVPLKTWFQRAIFEPWEISHGFAARNFAHLYMVGGRQHSDVAKMRSNNIAAYCFTLDLYELHEGHAKRIRICEKH